MCEHCSLLETLSLHVLYEWGNYLARKQNYHRKQIIRTVALLPLKYLYKLSNAANIIVPQQLNIFLGAEHWSTPKRFHGQHIPQTVLRSTSLYLDIWRTLFLSVEWKIWMNWCRTLQTTAIIFIKKCCRIFLKIRKGESECVCSKIEGICRC